MKFIDIPAHYNDPTQSGLTFEVKAGQQPLDIEMK
jgi:hypothetical protein